MSSVILSWYVPESRLTRLSVFGSINPGGPFHVVLSVPVPPKRFSVMLPSVSPEQETLLIEPLEKIALGSLMTNVAESWQKLSSVMTIL